MKKILFLVFALSGFFCHAQVTGFAYLNGQVNHSGIKVKFVVASQTGQTDSTYTNASGAYSINLIGGVYYVTFSCPGYIQNYYNNGQQTVVPQNSTLNNVTLYAGVAVNECGAVSGVWDSSHVYIITCNVTVNAGDSLRILPGTQVRFNGNYEFIANGKLLVQGDPNHPVLFTSNMASPAANDWKQITINNTQSIISNAIIEYPNTGLNIWNSSPRIDHCEILNSAMFGMYCWNCSSDISNCLIHDYGFIGIWFESGGAPIIECSKVYNGTGYGIDIEVNAICRNNEIYNITGGGNGYGIACQNATCNPILDNNYIHDASIGIKIDAYSSNPINATVTNNTIVSMDYIGIYQGGPGSSVIANNIVDHVYGSGNYAFECYSSSAQLTISHNLLWNNTLNFNCPQITGLGQIVTTNANGDPIDSYNNLFQDPLFSYIPALYPNSPCLNAGDATHSSDIGFNPVFSCQNVQLSVSNNNPELGFGFYPNPTNDMLYLDFGNIKGVATVSLFNMTGELVYSSTQEASDFHSIPVSGLASGVYSIRSVVNENVFVDKVIIER